MKFLAALLVLAAVTPLAAGFFYATGDTSDIFIPLESFYRQEQLAGRLPTWMPDAAWGFPVLASAQIGFFYPPLLLTRWLPFQIYLPLNLAAHLVLMSLGTYFFLKKTGRSQEAALLGAISFTLSAFIFQHLTHLNIIFAIAWFPLQLFAVQKVTLSERSESKSNLVWLSVLLAIPFLAGQIQVPLLMALVTSVYFFYSSPDRGRLGGVWLRLALLTALAAGLAAAQLLPTAELAWHSTRGANSDFDIDRANQYSWPLYHAPTLLFPRFFGNQETYWGKKLEVEQGFFIGTLPLLLALLSFAAPREALAKWGHARFFKWLTAISFLLALGSLSPFRLLGLEPSLWFFSAPARWLLFTTFGLSLLAAHGWDRIFTPGVELKISPRGWVWVSSIIIILVLSFNLALFLTPPALIQKATANLSTYNADKIQSLLASARTSSLSLRSPYTALPLIILAAAPFLLGRRRGKHILLAVTAAELVVVAISANPIIPWHKALEAPTTLSQLPENVREKEARLYSLRNAEQRGLLLTDPSTNENAGTRQQFHDTLIPLIHAQFGLAGVAWPAALDLSENAKVLHALDQSLRAEETKLAEELNIGAILYPDSTPGVELASSPGVEVQVLHPAPRASLRLANGREVPAQYREITPSHIEIKTSSNQESTLIVRDTFYPGWHATLTNTNPDSDPGSELEVFRTDRIFRAVSLPLGKHTVAMKYVPRLLYIGLTISLGTLLIVGFTVFHSRSKLTT